MAELDIQCPQPTRPFLKRKVSQLDSIDDSIHSQPACKQQRLITPPLASLRQFSRSDSFITRNMTMRPDPSRPLTAPISPPESTSWPPSVQTSVSYPSRQYSPVLRPTSTRSSGTESSNRVTSPSYRDDLHSHRIHIDSQGNIPPHVQSFAQAILQKGRTSPGLTDNEVSQLRLQLSEQANADEDSIKTTLSASAFFPASHNYLGQPYVFARGGNIPFDKKGLPYVQGFRLPPVSQPKPDLHYGYSRHSFTNAEYSVMKQPRILPYARPNSANYWPFFAVEVKSPSRGGTTWVAENQNAGTGAHCVNSMNLLLEYTNSQPRSETQSLAFTSVADYNGASLWIHWRELGEDGRFMMSEIDYFRFKRPDDIRGFRAKVRNIIEFGLGDRLDTIKGALMELFPQVERWEDEDRSGRVRRRSDTDDNATVRTSFTGASSTSGR
ncbi:hypothetical protein GJ744_005987 [Endocarpon pusillum]|uniref:DUF7924 domain-containing protein n=1 Tax=Endocarpon pusillum TaxID=364733 RepID=A0A8H7A8B2_9EURO|nr:hypothetical protein GJ744_005987 [Endocarpon pusillum]